MELKNYQKAVIRDLERYLEILMQTKNIETAYTRLWQEKDVKVGFGGMPKYQNLLPGCAECLPESSYGRRQNIFGCKCHRADFLRTGRGKTPCSGLAGSVRCYPDPNLGCIA